MWGSRIMQGGTFRLWRCDPAELARKIDLLVSGASLEAGVAASTAWAESLDWNVWEDRYTDKLRSVCAWEPENN